MQLTFDVDVEAFQPEFVAGAERVAEANVILLRHAEQVDDHQRGERLGILGQEFALAVGDELVELALGKPQDELFVLLEPGGGQQPRKYGARVWSDGSMVTMCSHKGS